MPKKPYIVHIITLYVKCIMFCLYASQEERTFIQELGKFTNLPQEVIEELNNKTTSLPMAPKKYFASGSSTLPLTKAYPILAQTLPYISLGSFPTPIYLMKNFSEQCGSTIYIKQDNLSGRKSSTSTRFFGGNKLRKLEFLLADALNKGAQTVLTFGGFGSNHATCTAIYAKELNLRCIVLLKPQPSSYILRRNLLLMKHFGAEFNIYTDNNSRSLKAIQSFKHNKEKNGDFPYIIPAGGSSPLGIVGFINAAFELKEQIDSGIIPEPDAIYIPLGSGGTVLGLLIGLKVLNIKTKLIAVATEPESPLTITKVIKTKFDETIEFINKIDPSFPKINYDQESLEIRSNQSGIAYGVFTPEGTNAQKFLYESEKIKLDGTYTAKAFACLLDDIENKKLENKNILFWNTFYAGDSLEYIAEENYLRLPKIFHGYFEEPVQQLDFDESLA